MFAELARLPEPLPLGDPAGPVPDLLAPPTGTFNDGTFADSPFAPANVGAAPDGAVELVDSSPGALAAPIAFGLAADAPPIDVAMRQGSRPLGPRHVPTRRRPAPEPEPAWETDGWQPPEPPGAETGGPVGLLGGHRRLDARRARRRDSRGVRRRRTRGGRTEIVAETVEPSAQTPWVSDLEPTPWAPAEPVDARADDRPVDRRRVAARARGRRRPVGPRARPGGRDTGFYVDWGTPETEPAQPEAAETSAPAWDAEPQPAWDVAPQPVWDTAPQPAWDTVQTFEDTATDADTPLDVEETPEPQPVWDTAPQPAWDTVHAFEDTATDADIPLDVEETAEPQPVWDTDAATPPGTRCRPSRTPRPTPTPPWT